MATGTLSQPSTKVARTTAVMAAPTSMARAYRLLRVLSVSAWPRKRNDPTRAVSPAAMPMIRSNTRLPGHRNCAPMPKNCSEKPALPSTTSA
ncbi:hypothetical protein D3C71_1465080 [compost metagenome]